MTNELATYEVKALAESQPAMTIEAMQNRYQMMARVAREIMHDGQDFGVVPGTGSKPSLFKPGAEKLTVFFGLQKRFEIIEKVEDWTGKDHNGEPFFYYMVRCYLSRNGMEVASMEGSCNSWEKKYRYRQGERACPKCGAAAIIKGKSEYGGGWLCFNKKGGCGAKFKDGDATIEGQNTAQVPNADIFDQVNTVLKIAEKRALVATTLVATGASEFFTQDMEDIIDAQWTEHAPMQYSAAESAHTLDGNRTAYGSNGEIADDQIVDAQWTEHAIARQRVKPANTAIMPPAQLIEYLRDESKRLHSKYQDAPPTPAQSKGLVAAMNQVAGGDSDRRHTFYNAVYQVKSNNDLSKRQTVALLNWINSQQDENGEWYIIGNPNAVEEFNRVVTAAIGENAVGDLFGQEAA